MAANAVLDFLAVDSAGYEIGILYRHMTIDAIAGEICSDFGEKAAVFGFVTSETFPGVSGGSALWRVKIMARRAGHVW